MKLRALLILAALTFAACDDAVLMSASCELPCYTGPAGTVGVGECRHGTPVCSKTGTLAACRGEIVPAQEICDPEFRDEDCDGRSNESDPTWGDYCPGTDVGECQRQQLACREGKMTCVGGQLPREERCLPNRDFDCDGIPMNPAPRGFCYSGPPETATQGVCRAGQTQCVSGAWLCVGEITPIDKDICPAIGPPQDANCDGVVDTTPTADIVYIFDRSCSMAVTTQSGVTRLEKHRRGLIRLAQTAGAVHRQALILLPDEANPDSYFVAHDFEDGDIVPALSSFGLSGASEPVLDAIYDVINGYSGLTLRSPVTVFMIVQDEPPESRRALLLQEAVAAVAGDRVKVYVLGVTTNLRSWVPIADRFYDIDTDTATAAFAPLIPPPMCH